VVKASRFDVETTNNIANGLRELRRDLLDDENNEMDVRLQVYPDGSWSLRYGPSDYDQDHRGYWGAGSIALDDGDETLDSVARELVEQALDQAATSGDLDEDEDEDE
jgi:hypothetical protein